MLSKDLVESPDESPTPPSAGADAAGASTAVMNPRDPVEVASAGTPPVNDPAAKDTKPPGFEDLALLI